MSVRMITCIGWNGYVFVLLLYFWDRTDRDVNAETRGQIVARSVDGIGGGKRRRRSYVC